MVAGVVGAGVALHGDVDGLVLPGELDGVLDLLLREESHVVLVKGLAFTLALIVAEGRSGAALEEVLHAPAVEARDVEGELVDEGLALGLHKDAEVDGGDLLVARVLGGVAVEGELEARQILDGIANRVSNLALRPLGLLLQVEADEVVVELSLITPKSRDADLGGGGGGKALDARNEDAILVNVLHDDALEIRRDIGAVVQRALDLVQQLRRDGPDGDLAARARLLGEDTRSIMLNLSNGEADVLALVHEALEARVVATADVGGALDEMAGDERARNLIEVRLAVPAVIPHGRTNCGSGISNTASNDNVTSLAESLCDARAAKIASRRGS